MLMKLPEGVSSISIGEAGQLKEMAPGVVDVPDEHIAQAQRHGLTGHTEPIETDEDHTGKTKKELMAILEERGIEYDPRATKDVLLQLVSESEKGEGDE